MELVVVIGVMTILAVSVPPLVFQGVQSMVFLPKAQLANQTAMEILQAMIEDNLSSLDGQRVRGLRYAARRFQGNSSDSAIWSATATSVGFLTFDGQYRFIFLRLDGEAIKRSLQSAATCMPDLSQEEVIPYYAPGRVRILTSGALFRYYDQNGGEIVPPPGCPFSASTIRRIDIAFIAQTGGGSIDQGDAKVTVTSSVAIRFP